MPKELVIPTDDPNVMKAFDPYSVQGMINALTFFAREHGKDMKTVNSEYGVVYMAVMGDVHIIIRPTDSKLATRHAMVSVVSGAVTTTLGVFNPDKVEYDEGEAIKFYARDPAGVLTIDAVGEMIEVDLKVTDMRHQERVHGGTINTHII